MEETFLNSPEGFSNGMTSHDENIEHKLDEDVEEKTASFREKWKNPVFKEKIIYSFFMAAVFVSLGMYVGQHGPTFLDIQIITDTDIKASSAFFTGGNAGYLTGSIIIGLIYDKMNKALLMFIVTIGLGLTNIIVPYCTVYELMILIRFLTALFGGGIDTAINSEHMRIWGSDANGLLQFQHFCFSFGGCMSPLIAEPFLAEKPDVSKTNSTTGNGSVSSNSTIHHNLGPSDTRVEYLFLIVGIFSVISSIPFFFIFLRKHGRKELTKKAEKRRFFRKGVPFPLLIVMLISICFFYFAYCCVEDTFFSFLMTFLVKEFDSISKSKGALTNAIAWASFAVARFLMIFMTKVLTTVPLLFLMISAMAVAFSSFTIFAHFAIVDALIVFSAISALSCSGVFASGFSWMETEMFPVTGIISSCILVASSLGSIVNPLILGYLMEEVNNMWFCYILVIDTFALCLLFLGLLAYSRCYIDKKYGTLASSSQTNKTIMIDSPEQNNSDDIKNHEVGDGNQNTPMIFT